MKKNLIILLLIPFLVALLGIAAVNTTFNLIAPDIISIKWDYDAVEAFKLSTTPVELIAEGVSDERYETALGNQLVWKVTGKDGAETDAAKITYSGVKTYLETLKEGEVIITCSNKKGNVFRSMEGIIYENGAVVITPVEKPSQNNIDPNIYYGEYDFNENNSAKVNASFDLKVNIVPEELTSSTLIKEMSNNIEFDLTSKKVKINGEGDSFIRIGFLDESIAPDQIFKFKVVDEGVNVYDYQDLLACTNASTDGEIAVLRKSFESVNNTYVKNGDNILMQGDEYVKQHSNVELFGTYLGSKNSYNFANEVAYIETTFNKDYINEWNEFAGNNPKYSEISSEFIAGLHVKKDFYGNGFTINMHNLTYPYSENRITDTATGNAVSVPLLTNDNLFRGPLPFYTLGDPNRKPLVTAYGQDNVGMYVDGNDILINDINLRNCDFGNNLANLEYVGTTLEANGKGIVIKNSRLSAGKNVMRCFSSDVTVDNCMFSNSQNFLITTGSNEYLKIDGDRVVEWSLADGSTKSLPVSEFLAKNGLGDELITSYLAGSFDDRELMRQALEAMSNGLNEKEQVEGVFKGELNINDCIFYQSGVSAIALETLFNGPYLYSNIPSLIGTIFGMLTDDKTNTPIIPLEASDVGGTAFPVKVNISGNTNFYDYKNVNSIDISGLIFENISEIAQDFGSLFDKEIPDITIDDIFPIKTLLINEARKKNCTYNGVKDEVSAEYINIPVAFYGGGLNLSQVSFENLDSKDQIGEELQIDFLDSYLEKSNTTDIFQMMRPIMLKAVTVVTGTEPFKFICIKGNGYKFDETPDVSILIANAKGE